MKNRKWITYTLGTLLTLVVLALVAGVSFRLGMTRNATFMRPPFANNFTDRSPAKPGTLPENRNPQMMQGNQPGGFHGMQGNRFYQGFDPRGNDRFEGRQRHGHGMFLLPFLFGAFHLIILALLLWIAYKLGQRSGWRLVRVEEAPAGVANEPVDVVKEKKKKKN